MNNEILVITGKIADLIITGNTRLLFSHNHDYVIM